MFFGYNLFAIRSHKMLKTTLHMLSSKGFGLPNMEYIYYTICYFSKYMRIPNLSLVIKLPKSQLNYLFFVIIPLAC